MEKLPERLRELRKTHGKTQSDIARLLKVSRANYGYYEAGKQSPPLDKVVVIAEHYNVSLDYLIGNSDQQVIDVFGTIQHILNNIKNNNAIFNGYAISGIESELIACSLENTIQTGKIIERNVLK